MHVEQLLSLKKNWVDAIRSGWTADACKVTTVHKTQGRPSRPWGHDAFPPCFRLPSYFRKIFRLSGKFSKFYLFPKYFSIFIRQNFWWPFFSHRPQIFHFPPIFPVSVHFPQCFAKIITAPYFGKFLPCFIKIYLHFAYFMCISFSPYFDHDAFMHHPMHVLDAPDKTYTTDNFIQRSMWTSFTSVHAWLHPADAPILGLRFMVVSGFKHSNESVPVIKPYLYAWKCDHSQWSQHSKPPKFSGHIPVTKLCWTKVSKFSSKCKNHANICTYTGARGHKL